MFGFLKGLSLTLLSIIIFGSYPLSAQAYSKAEAPPPSQDAIIQRLKLSPQQLENVNLLYQKFDADIRDIQLDSCRIGIVTDMFSSGMWKGKELKKELAAFSHLDEQMSYLRIKYYFNVSKVLNNTQRSMFRDDFIAAIKG
ncbi:Spy/CpxP family protein refolding chaperone [Dryocola sp. LX212]